MCLRHVNDEAGLVAWKSRGSIVGVAKTVRVERDVPLMDARGLAESAVTTAVGTEAAIWADTVRVMADARRVGFDETEHATMRTTLVRFITVWRTLLCKLGYAVRVCF